MAVDTGTGTGGKGRCFAVVSMGGVRILGVYDILEHGELG